MKNGFLMKCAILAACVLLPASAFAWPVNISVGASTLGFGVQAATAIIPGTLDVAVGLNRFNYAKSGTYQNTPQCSAYNHTVV